MAIDSSSFCGICDNYSSCPQEDRELAIEHGYCSAAVIRGVWATIDSKNIYLEGSGESISRGISDSILALRIDRSKQDKNSLVEGTRLTE
jgi:hypothetical protein